MEKRIFLVFALLLAIIPIASAANITVSLTTPDDASSSSSASVTFGCTAEDSLNAITSIELYTDTTGTWAVNPTSSGSPLSLSISGIPNGNYNWNCRATNNINETAFASSNRTFTVSVAANTAPLFSGTIANQSFNEDSSISSAFDLDTYFTDSQTLTYTASGNSQVTVTIAGDNTVSFSAAANWSGNETIRFTASDGSLTNVSNYITVSVASVNDAPYYSTIPSQNWTKNTNKTIDLSSYFHDVEGSSMTYNVSSKPANISITFSGATATLSPDSGWTGTKIVTFTANDSVLTTTSNTVTLTVTSNTNNSAPTCSLIGSGTGKLSSRGINEEKPISFLKKEDADGDTLTVKWFVDNVEVTGETSDTFKFSKPTAGDYVIKAIVSDGELTGSCSVIAPVTDESTDESGIDTTGIDVKSLIADQTGTGPNCGDGFITEEENCVSCPEDVQCNENEDCDNELKVCVPKNPSSAKLIIVLSIIILAVAGGGFAAYKMTTKKSERKMFNTANTLDSEVKERPSVDIHDIYEQRKKENIFKKEPDAPRPIKVDNPLRKYASEMRKRGYNDKEIRKKLLEKGWSESDVKDAF